MVTTYIRRKDSKGRVLRTGESERKDGLYQFRYMQNGKRKTIYASDLKELREKAQKALELKNIGLRYSTASINVLELVQKYINLKTGVRYATQVGYKYISNILEKDPFGQRPIRSIQMSQAKEWMKKLFYEAGYKYSSISAIKGVLAPAFQMAYEEDVIRKNPFSFNLSPIISNNTKQREALSDEVLRDWLDFMKNDNTYSKYYDEIIVLLGTGLRVSELCGLTLNDLDFSGKRIKVDKQLSRTRDGKYYIEKTKTSNGTRYIPMLPEVYKSLDRIVQSRNAEEPEIVIDGIIGFILLDKNNRPKVASHIQHEIQWGLKKYKKQNPNKIIPVITPHVLRHTFCTNMVRNGMNVKNVQYIMGHSDVTTTLNIYTHTRYDDAEKDMMKISLLNGI